MRLGMFGENKQLAEFVEDCPDGSAMEPASFVVGEANADKIRADSTDDDARQGGERRVGEKLGEPVWHGRDRNAAGGVWTSAGLYREGV
jgi:hypothetical protein